MPFCKILLSNLTLCIRKTAVLLKPPLTGLVSHNLTGNSFSSLPPALAAATSLTELSLAMNNNLVLTTDGVNGILSRLPHLRRLYLDKFKMPLGVLVQLLVSAPQLQISESP